VEYPRKERKKEYPRDQLLLQLTGWSNSLLKFSWKCSVFFYLVKVCTYAKEKVRSA